MKRGRVALATLLFLMSPLTFGQADTAFLLKVLAYEKPWDKFVRQLFGCEPVGETNQNTCNLSRGMVDFKSYNEAREAAKKLFDLRDREK